MTPGMTGVGHTVIRGTTVVPFDVEILGVLRDAIFLGVDIVVAEITGPADFLEETGGAAGGMSGSPIIIDGKLAGALAWRIAEDRHLFGMTAAEDMVGIFDLEDADPTSVPSRIQLSRQVIEAARASGSMLTDTAALESLPLPLGVSGNVPVTLSEIEESFAERGIRVAAFRSGSVASPTAQTFDPSPFLPGEGLGVGLSFGDVSFYTFGTTTAVCGDVALGFGHPGFFGGGEVSIAMTDVDVIGIDNGLFGGTKIGTLGDTHGLLTQDRFAGVAGLFGVMPTLVPITSDVSSPDTGLSRHGVTDVTWDDEGFMAEVAYYHAFRNFSYALQSEEAGGTIDFHWTIEGTREDGSTFTVENRWFEATEFGVPFRVFRMVDAMYELAFNPFEPIEFTSVDIGGDITEEQLVARIGRVRTSSSLQPRLASRSVLRARPGDRITIEVTLNPTEDGSTSVATMTFRLPAGAGGRQHISLKGGGGRPDRFQRPRSFDDLLDALNGGDHANDLIARGFGRSVLQAQDVEVKGRASVTVQIVR
jgi:hypothetical protein